MTEHLEILGDVFARRVGMIEAVREADAFDGRLRNTLDDRRWLDAQRIQHRRYHVDCVCVLRADLALCLDPFGPMYDKRVAGATAIGLAFPAAERGITRPGPTPGIVVEGFWPTYLVQFRQAFLQRFLCVVEELPLVGRAGGATFGTGSVIRNHHDQSIVELAGALQ